MSPRTRTYKFPDYKQKKYKHFGIFVPFWWLMVGGMKYHTIYKTLNQISLLCLSTKPYSKEQQLSAPHYIARIKLQKLSHNIEQTPRDGSVTYHLINTDESNTSVGTQTATRSREEGKRRSRKDSRRDIERVIL